MELKGEENEERNRKEEQKRRQPYEADPVNIPFLQTWETRLSEFKSPAQRQSGEVTEVGLCVLMLSLPAHSSLVWGLFCTWFLGPGE